MFKDTLIFFAFLFFIFGCKQELQFGNQITQKAYQAVLQQKSSQNISTFINAVNKDYDTAKTQTDKLKVLNDALKACQLLELEKESQNYEYALLNEDFSSKETPARLFNLAEKSRTAGKVLPSEIVYTGILENFKDAPEAKLSKQYVKLSKVQLENELTKLGLALYNENGPMDQSKAKEYINAAEAWSIVFPKDTSSAEFLFKAGEVARGTSSWLKSNSLYTNLIAKFPNHKHTPVAMFIKGFVLETEFKDPMGAQKVFKDFVGKYPNHPLAKDAQFLIDNAGKDDSQLLKEAQNAK
jgi:TolA-binding protein